MERLEPVQFKTPQEELAYLREQMRLREAELLSKGFPAEKQEIAAHEISKYNALLSKDVLSPELHITPQDTEAIVLNLAPERHDKKIEELFGVLREKGLKNALSVLESLKDPHLADDFHRFLVQYFAHGYGEEEKKQLSKEAYRGITMALYEVVLPEEKTEEKKGLKEIVSSMEQFFSGLLSIQHEKVNTNYISFEIANSNGSDQFIFYIAVPETLKQLFEKNIISVFPNIRLTETPDDYNIFNEEGVSLGSYATYKEPALYPFKTYEHFDYDPLNIILNSFSKIEKDGEGAALQLIFFPRGDFYKVHFEHAKYLLEKGVPTKEATDTDYSFSHGLVKTIGQLFTTHKPKEGEQKIDSDAIERITRKVGAPIVSTNIRLLVSSKSRPDAERILRTLESSFNQFTDTLSNSIEWKHIADKKMNGFARNFSFRVYDEHENLPLNFHELTSIIHFHSEVLQDTPQLKQTGAIAAPAPGDLLPGGTVLGVNSYHNTDTVVHIGDDDRLRHFYTIGQTGTGKSTLLKNMIIQDVIAGNGVCMIDPHGIDILDVLSNIPKERYSDVIYFDPSYTERPMALNMLEYDPRFPEQKTFVVNELFSIFQKLYGAVLESMGPIFEQYFRNATMLVIEDPESGSTLLDVSRVLADKAYRQLKISRCKNPVVVQFWTEVAEKAGGEASLANIVPYITSKFDVFLANDIMRPIIAQQESSFDFREIMDDKKILLVNLAKGRLGDINANLIGLILVGKILMAALSRTDLVGTDFPPFYLYIDEFQNITTNSIATILSEARKYKLALSIAHQFIAQLDEKIRDAVFGNVGSVCAFRVGAEDAEYLEKQFAPTFTARDIMNIENRNAYVKMLVGGRPAKAFNIRTLPPPPGDPKVIEPLKQLSYLSYGGDRKEIEAEILKKYKK